MWVYLDGQLARIGWEQKATLIENGILSLGADWRDRVPPIEVEDTPLRGCVKNPELFQLFSDFMGAVKRQEIELEPAPSLE